MIPKGVPWVVKGEFLCPFAPAESWLDSVKPLYVVTSELSGERVHANMDKLVPQTGRSANCRLTCVVCKWCWRICTPGWCQMCISSGQGNYSPLEDSTSFSGGLHQLILLYVCTSIYYILYYVFCPPSTFSCTWDFPLSLPLSWPMIVSCCMWASHNALYRPPCVAQKPEMQTVVGSWFAIQNCSGRPHNFSLACASLRWSVQACSVFTVPPNYGLGSYVWTVTNCSASDDEYPYWMESVKPLLGMPAAWKLLGVRHGDTTMHNSAISLSACVSGIDIAVTV